MTKLRSKRLRAHRPGKRPLFYEPLESRQMLAADSDDTLIEALILGNVSTTPRTVSASILPDTDVDMYRITVTAGQIIDFDIDTTQNGPGGLGSFLRLFNALGQQIAFNNDAAAPGENVVGFDAYLRFTFTTAGNYYVGVSNFSNTLYNVNTGEGDIAGGLNAVGNYQLTVQRLLDDTDDTLGDATFLGAITTTPIPRNSSINPDIDVDLYRFSVTAGRVVDFDIDTSLNGPGGLGSFLRLFDAQGQELAFNDNAVAPGENVVGLDSYLRFTFATAGTYYIGVSNSNNRLYNPTTGANDTAGGLNSMGDYLLTIQLAPVVPVDPDDTLVEATVLGAVTTTPIPINDSITPDTDVDLYRFTAAAGQIVDFDIDTTINGPGGLGSFLRLFNAQGQEIAFNNDAAAPGESAVGFDAYVRFTFTTAGTYYVGVSNVNNTLYDATTGGNDTTGGTNATGNYQLIVQALPVDTDDSLVEATSLGAILTIPIPVNGTINPDIDVDLYRFTVSAGRIVDFDIDTPLNGPGGLGSFLRLFNAQGQELAFNDNATAPGENVVGFDAYLRFTFTTAGTYYIGVSNFSNTLYNPSTGANDTAGGLHSIGNYLLTIQTAPVVPVDPDDTLSDATVLGAISTTPILVNDSITPDIDVDLYRFTVTAGRVVDFDIDTTLNGPGGLGSFLRLFNAQGQQIAFNNDAAAPGENVVGFDSYLRFTFATAGTFYVGVSNFSNTLYDATTGGNDTAGGSNATGNYQLIVQALPDDTDDSLTEATFLGAIGTAPVPVSASITPDIDVDLYRFTVLAGRIVDFDIDTTLNGSGGLGSYLRLFDAQGQQLAFNDNAAAPGENVVGFDAYLRFTFTAAGTYYIGVSNFNNILYNPSTGAGDTVGGLHSIGDYQLTIQAATVVPVDTDDSLLEATILGAISTTPFTLNDSITPDTDVDLYRITATVGQELDIDIDTPINGPGGLGSYLRLFNAQGQEIAFNNDAAAPGESTVGFDAYIRFSVTTAGTYYIGVSNANNTQYNATTGANDVSGGANATGAYQLIVRAVPVSNPSLHVAFSVSAIPELNGTANGTVTRNSANISQSLLVNLTSSDNGSATVPATVVIAANQLSSTFTVLGVHDTTRRSRRVTITAGSTGFSAGTASLLVSDSDRIWHNFNIASDVDNDGVVSPFDVLRIINFLIANGSGPVPIGSPPPFLDVDADNFVSPSDVIRVINDLNRAPLALSAQAEGESTASSRTTGAQGNTFPSPYVDDSLSAVISLLAPDVAEQFAGRKPRRR